VKVSEHLYVLKHTRCPAVLVEVGFVDSRHDVEILTRPENQVYLVALLARGIREWLLRPQHA
jgi:N-acetylmuramoyl-L-alanine amidase